MTTAQRLADIPVSVIPAAGVRVDTGTGYGRRPGAHDAFLTDTDADTPCGEFMRRYWQPVALSKDATTTPQQIRILGEDLILFRDQQGRPGLLLPHCVHRGTSLLYGKCEDDGIRCCYHGWKFDVQGNCLDQPCEPDGGRRRELARQPWYPVEEQYGLIWAYMGPPEKKPLLQKYDIFENLAADEYIEADDFGRATGGYGKRFIVPCNYLQHVDNLVDPAHVQILHIRFTGFQFTSDVPVRNDPWTFEYTPDGVKQGSVGYYADGRKLVRTFGWRVPGERRVSDPWLSPGPMSALGWTVPVDNHHYMVFSARKHLRGKEFYTQLKMSGKTWDKMTDAERRNVPSDYEAQVGQGVIASHADEHLATTDRGVVMLRRMLRKQIEMVQAGGDPVGVIFDPAQQVVVVEGGNYFSGPA